jgi:hypothetical protein
MKYRLFVYVDVDICLVAFRIERFTDGSAVPQHLIQQQSGGIHPSTRGSFASTNH